MSAVTDFIDKSKKVLNYAISIFSPHDIFDPSLISKDEKVTKNRHWRFIVYLDSAPDSWLDDLRSLNLPLAISPYHDKDITAEGDIKKPHYHGIISFEGPTTWQNANKIIQRITNGPIVKVCNSIRGAYRYLIHADDPDKFQYDENDIRVFNNFEVALTSSDEDRIKRAIFCIILVNRITEYAELMLVLEYEFGYEYGQVARRNHNYISSVINSVRHNNGATYKRFMSYVTPGEFNLYALSEEFSYENSKKIIDKIIAKHDKLLGLDEGGSSDESN